MGLGGGQRGKGGPGFRVVQTVQRAGAGPRFRGKGLGLGPGAPFRGREFSVFSPVGRPGGAGRKRGPGLSNFPGARTGPSADLHSAGASRGDSGGGRRLRGVRGSRGGEKTSISRVSPPPGGGGGAGGTRFELRGRDWKVRFVRTRARGNREREWGGGGGGGGIRKNGAGPRRGRDQGPRGAGVFGGTFGLQNGSGGAPRGGSRTPTAPSPHWGSENSKTGAPGGEPRRVRGRGNPAASREDSGRDLSSWLGWVGKTGGGPPAKGGFLGPEGQGEDRVGVSGKGAGPMRGRGGPCKARPRPRLGFFSRRMGGPPRVGGGGGGGGGGEEKGLFGPGGPLGRMGPRRGAPPLRLEGHGGGRHKIKKTLGPGKKSGIGF